MLTQRGILFVLTAVLTWLAGRTLGIAELFAVSVASLAIVLLGVIYVRVATGSISVRRDSSHARVVAGSAVTADLDLRNDSFLPSPTLLVTESLPATVLADGHPVAGEARFVMAGVAPGKIARASYVATATTRGKYQLGPVALLVRDPFGVAERRRDYQATNELLVYPRVEPLPSSPVRGLHMGTGSSDARRVLASGDEFFTIREYVRGDDLRHVHWASTAHRDTLMVRQMDQPWQAHATVFLDSRAAAHSEGPTGTLERAVSVAASMVYHLDEASYALRLVTDDTAGRTSPDFADSAMAYLATLPATSNPSLAPSLSAARGGEGLFVGILGVPPGTGTGDDDLGSHPDMRALFGLRGFGQRIAIVVAEAGSARADRMVGLLSAAGWAATAITAGEPLAPAWAAVTGTPRRRGAQIPPATAAGMVR
ncbi:DUF58 domain-containing protein [Euzebya tangerina]|uniref:DUF58 domain-containing protein n=1 Tax=Euzebya tangerina TaxID=591198 RepID=UPI000E3224FD|nr:DUF58 domain-containing protein [Euzebya tangerina]